MADNVVVTAGTGTSIAADEVADATLGSCKVQYVKIMDGTLDSTTKATVSSAGLLVAQGTAANLLATVSQGTAANLLATVSQGTAANLNATVTGTVIAISGTAGNLLATVNQGTASNLLAQVSGTVTAVSGTAGNFLSTVAGTVTAVSGTAANLLAQVSGTVTAVSGTAGNLLATVSQGTAANLLASVVGTVADDGTTPGNPVMIGGMAVETDGTDPTSVSAEADIAILRTDRQRRLLVSADHPYMWSVSPAAYSSAQTDAEIKAAPGANLSLYITDIIVSNGATAGTITFEEDTATAKTKKFATLYLAVNGGCAISLKTPIRCTANKNFGITSATVTTHSVTINGYTAP